jgi:hypothetical protein
MSESKTSYEVAGRDAGLPTLSLVTAPRLKEMSPRAIERFRTAWKTYLVEIAADEASGGDVRKVKMVSRVDRELLQTACDLDLAESHPDVTPENMTDEVLQEWMFGTLLDDIPSDPMALERVMRTLKYDMTEPDPATRVRNLYTDMRELVKSNAKGLTVRTNDKCKFMLAALRPVDFKRLMAADLEHKSELLNCSVRAWTMHLIEEARAFERYSLASGGKIGSATTDKLRGRGRAGRDGPGSGGPGGPGQSRGSVQTGRPPLSFRGGFGASGRGGSANQRGRSRPPRREASSTTVCFGCGVAGHFRRDCLQTANKNNPRASPGLRSPSRYHRSGYVTKKVVQSHAQGAASAMRAVNFGGAGTALDGDCRLLVNSGEGSDVVAAVSDNVWDYGATHVFITEAVVADMERASPSVRCVLSEPLDVELAGDARTTVTAKANARVVLNTEGGPLDLGVQPCFVLPGAKKLMLVGRCVWQQFQFSLPGVQAATVARHQAAARMVLPAADRAGFIATDPAPATALVAKFDAARPRRAVRKTRRRRRRPLFPRAPHLRL